MTTLWADGFGSTTASDYNYSYAIPYNSLGFVAGRRAGSNALLVGNYATVTKSLPSSASTIFVSMAYKIGSFDSSNTKRLLRIQEGGGDHINIRFGPSTSGLTVYRDTVYLGGTVDALVAGVWYWIQVKVVIHATAGSVEIRDGNGTVLLNLTGQNTMNGGSGVCNAVSLGDSVFLIPFYVCDYHIWNTVGSICNTWTNETRVDVLRPDAAGDATQFTPSVGANYTCVNEAQLDLTNSVASSTVAQQDLYNFTALSHVPISIFGGVRKSIAAKDDAGARSIKLLTKSGTTLSTGATQGLTNGSYALLAEVVEADPSTAVAWTAAGIAASQHGYEVV